VSEAVGDRRRQRADRRHGLHADRRPRGLLDPRLNDSALLAISRP
jgi:hypothetical protein